MHRFSPNPNLAHLVRWHEDENDAFQKALEQDRPVLLFLGAFWCRYCQRMDEEAFSDRENMALLNAYFVALRVENAKRPDIDARYNLNGWPTLAFLAPNGKLLAAANYLPADEFKELLLNMYMEYERSKEDIRSMQMESNPVAGVRIKPSATRLAEITDVILSLADPVNGGYGRRQKFIQAEADEFLLCRYEATGDARYLDAARLTLDRMRAGPIYDENDGGYFRTTTGADWTQPHREKLLGEHAGLLKNCLQVFRLTHKPAYARMAEEIIDYLDRKLFDPGKPAFLGCEDFLRHDEKARTDDFFTIIDECVYTDQNALAIVAYLDAAVVLNRPECKVRALAALEFLWRQNRSEREGMFHYSDEAPRAPGLLSDQARMGIALVEAFRATGDQDFLDRAVLLTEFIRVRLTNPAGGYYDRGESPLGFFGARLTLIDQNGLAASFFLMLAEATRETNYREAALWALGAFGGDFGSWGIHGAPFGRALVAWEKGLE